MSGLAAERGKSCPVRIHENLAVFDFALDNDDKVAIATLDGTYGTAPHAIRALRG